MDIICDKWNSHETRMPTRFTRNNENKNRIRVYSDIDPIFLKYIFLSENEQIKLVFLHGKISL